MLMSRVGMFENDGQRELLGAVVCVVVTASGSDDGRMMQYFVCLFVCRTKLILPKQSNTVTHARIAGCLLSLFFIFGLTLFVIV